MDRRGIFILYPRVDSPVDPQAPKPKPAPKPAPAPKAPPKAKAAAKPKPKAKPAPKKAAWSDEEDEESDGFVGSDSDDDNFASSAPVAPRARSGRTAATKKTYQFDSDDDAADDGDFPMTQETVEAPRPAPMEESDEEFVRAGVVTSARRRDGPAPHAATVAPRAGVRGGQGRAAQAGAEAEEGRRAAQGAGQEAAGQEKAERLELG